MSTSVQSLQNNQFAQTPNAPSQQTQVAPREKKVTFQQPPVANASVAGGAPVNTQGGAGVRLPHRLPKQEMELPHPGSVQGKQRVVTGEKEKGLKIPEQHTKVDDGHEQYKEVGVVVLLSMFLFSNIVQDCLACIIPNGRYEGKPTLVTSLVNSLLMGCAFFLIKKFLL